MFARSLRLGTALFLGLLSIGTILVALVFWHHQAIVNQPLSSSAPDVHTDVYFVFSVTPLKLIAGTITAWLICVAAAYLWLTWRK